jgi:hypothetical protein
MEVKFSSQPKNFSEKFHGQGRAGAAIIKPSHHSLIVASDHDGGPPKFRGPRMEALVHRPELFNVNVS